jgi:hypothetical protein
MSMGFLCEALNEVQKIKLIKTLAKNKNLLEETQM